MKDCNVQWPSRYKDTLSGQIFNLEKMPGEVTEAGSVYNKASVLPDSVCQALKLPTEAAEPKDAFSKAAAGYRTASVYGKNIAYMLSQFEILGKVQDHSHVFYDVFYPAHTAKIGYIDNRKIAIRGTLQAGAQTIPAGMIDLSTYPITNRYANGNWQELTIKEGAKSEVIYAHDAVVFDSNSHEGAFPADITISEAGTYRFTLLGGKGSNCDFGGYIGIGGNGGTVIFTAALQVGDAVRIEKIAGGGKGMKASINGAVVAAVGGGGDGGAGILYETKPSQGGAWPGGAGGGDNGGNGVSNFSSVKPGLGARGATGGVGVTGGGYDTSGKGRDDGGIGGQSIYRTEGKWHLDSNRGGGGYAGGAGGLNSFDGPLLGSAACGGGSSYVDTGAVTLIENSQGTNGGREYGLISKQDMVLKAPLQNSYTNPTLYRSQVTVDTTNHKATMPVGSQQLRILVRDISAFYDFAVWLQTTGITCSAVRISYGQSAEIDESDFKSALFYEHTGPSKEIHVDGSGTMTGGGRYLAVAMDLEAGETAALLSMYGALA